jgi:glucose/arabinose dehydrogenase
VRRLLIVALGLGLAAPGSAGAQGYTIPPGNPFVNTPGAQPEIYVYGMRNPYRWSFDRLTGDMYIGDVGGTREELTFLPRASQAGANLGWNCFSGTDLIEESLCDPPNDIPPTFEYPSSGDVVIGGPIVRDPALPAFAGRYLYARFDSGLYLRGPGAAPPEEPLTSLGLSAVAGLGEDGNGHLHVASLSGPVYRLVQNGSTLSTSKVGDFNQPLAVVAPPGDATRLYVVEKPGTVKNRDGSLFLDLVDQVSEVGEEGLLAMAVAPDYATSNRFFVFYTDNAGDLQLDEFRRATVGPDRSDIATRKPLLTIQHDLASNHNGGQLLFGPDNLLYLSTGDGGTQGDPERDAQSLGSLLGKILRIDVGVGAPPTAASPPPLADTARPRLNTRVPRRQRVLRLRGAVAYVRCNEACSLRAGGIMRIGKRRYRMARVSRAAQTHNRTRVKVGLTRNGRRALRRALRNGRRPSVRIGLRGTDAAGNRSLLVRRTVRVRR